MGIQDLQTFLDSNCVQGGSVPIDLLKIARVFAQKSQRNRVIKGQQLHNFGKLRLVLDGECCLDRLYGGFFSDWACGGQWNRMLQFLAVLIQAMEMSGLEIAVFFNGCFEPLRRADWVQHQLQMRAKVNNVLKHITTKGTPPPKIWWTPPVCLRTSLRMALRHLNVTVLCSMDDHHQEVIAYCRENNYNGLIADDAEYAAFDPPRYFSSEQLKLTYKGSLDTKEYMLSEFTKALNIPSDRLCILAALLGNYILTESDLADFYKNHNISTNVLNKTSVEQMIKTIANFVRELSSVELDVVSQKVFGSTSDPRCSKLRQSVQYYLNGTKEGFLHYKPVKPTKVHKLDSKSSSQTQSNLSDTPSASEGDSNLETSRFASETLESERESLNAYKQATANAKAAPQIVIDPPGLQGHGDSDRDAIRTEEEQSDGHAINGTHNLLISSSSSSSSSSATSPSHATADSAKQPEKTPNIPVTSPEVMRTASERHQKGLMSPYIYQILIAGEIKLPVLLEDENHREFPSIHVIYRPIRQMVYAILFNLHHRMYLATKSKEKGDSEKVEVPEVIIKEWVWSKSNPYQTPELVKAEQIGWGVPTIQRLWFGTVIDDKRRRLRGFLTCMRSDTPLILNTSYVPQHLLVMACVLSFEIAGVVVGQWGPNYGQPGRPMPQPLQGHPRGRIPPQVTSIGGLKYGLPRGFNPINRPTFQTRGTNRAPIAGRGKKTQMKVTGKKKTAIKKTTEKKDGRNRGTIADEITDYNEIESDDAARALLTKDASSVPGQFDDAVENGGKGMEKGQGDAPLVTPVATES
ncbi:constitutive coactivator of PPAR-gamma-like protein 1 homolog [Formica exsecta]|uniref:constitutive coactivator of PPAR-gamma-like protein 1 homolog n=1 Tax=Formica exsecta TaxID=72781 RepID=UPI0011443A08|nr:constitutive coactivator of PPAR-gamma-like protein 1 homolog [Formica exsecta]